MIGMVCTSVFQYYDSSQKKMAFKGRPILVIGKADAGDYVALPISRVTKKENLHKRYDYRIDPASYEKLNLKAISYIRTHKQSIVHEGEITRQLVDFRKEYPAAYKEVIKLVEEFQKELIRKAF